MASIVPTPGARFSKKGVNAGLIKLVRLTKLRQYLVGSKLLSERGVLSLFDISAEY